LTEKGAGAAAACRRAAGVLFLIFVVLVPGRAAAEKVLTNADGWQVFSDGRAGAFASYSYGDGHPTPVTEVDAAGNPVTISQPLEGGFRSVTEQQPFNPNDPNNAGKINIVRIRSGFISNVFGFGVRGPLTEWTKLSVYVQFWAYVENDGRQKNLPNQVDARQGWAKLEGPWGALTAGRVRALFSRGATDIDVMYAHRWGLGFPGSIDNRGPTLGQLGFGVLGNGFSSGIIYGTPNIAGLQLDMGIFDAVQLQGMGNWTRTKYPLAQAELTFQRPFRDGWGKVVVFGNGAFQKVYKDAACTEFTDAETGNIVPCNQTIAGAGYGGRLELGPVHLGVAGHYGQGLGLNYALEVSEAAQDKQGNLRKIAGWYGQLQVVVKKVDLFAGWGMVQVFLTDYDQLHKQADPRDPAATVFPYNVLKRRMGINAGIVYNASPNLHFDLDFFRAEALWYAVNTTSAGNPFPAPKQVVWVGNGGMTVNW
jgi:porin-like protein